jgi:hypothetical protein
VYLTPELAAAKEKGPTGVTDQPQLFDFFPRPITLSRRRKSAPIAIRHHFSFALAIKSAIAAFSPPASTIQTVARTAKIHAVTH